MKSLSKLCKTSTCTYHYFSVRKLNTTDDEFDTLFKTREKFLDDQQKTQQKRSSYSSLTNESRYKSEPPQPRNKPTPFLDPVRLKRQNRGESIPGSERNQRMTSSTKSPFQRDHVPSLKWTGNSKIALFKNSSEGGKRDIYFDKDQEDNNYHKQYTEFLIEHGFVEESDISEQYEWLKQSYSLQYDPDDSDGLRLPPNHAGRRRMDDCTEKEAYFGKSFKKEKLEFNHFNKSFILDSSPPFPSRMIHHGPNKINDEYMETPLYLPHITQNIPQWTLKKKITKTYGPSYMHSITMPPMKLPNNDDFQAMLKQFMNEKKWKKYGVDVIEKFENNVFNENNADEMYKWLNKRRPKRKVDNDKFVEENSNRIKNLGVGTPFHYKTGDIVPREYELWDIDLCFELKHDGDPSIPKEFKDEIFREYVTSIDRNGSMASWQKNYAFSLLPKAFGGPEGDYIEYILQKMKPKQEKIQYELKSYDSDDIKIENKKIDRKINKKQISGLGL